MGASSESKKRRRVLVAGVFVALVAVATLTLFKRPKEEAQAPSGPTAHGFPIAEYTKAQELDA